MQPLEASYPRLVSPNPFLVVKRQGAKGTGVLAQNLSERTETFSKIGRTPRGSCNRTLLRRVLRRFFKGSAFLEGFLEGTL